MGKPLTGSISDNSLANSPRIISLIYKNEQRLSNYSFATSLEWSALVRSQEGMVLYTAKR